MVRARGDRAVTGWGRGNGLAALPNPGEFHLRVPTSHPKCYVLAIFFLAKYLIISLLYTNERLQYQRSSSGMIFRIPILFVYSFEWLIDLLTFETEVSLC